MKKIKTKIYFLHFVQKIYKKNGVVENFSGKKKAVVAEPARLTYAECVTMTPDEHDAPVNSYDDATTQWINVFTGPGAERNNSHKKKAGPPPRQQGRNTSRHVYTTQQYVYQLNANATYRTATFATSPVQSRFFDSSKQF